MLALRQSYGIDCWHNDLLNIVARAAAIYDDVTLNNLALMLSSPLALLSFNWFNSLIIHSGNIYIAYWIVGMLSLN